MFPGSAESLENKLDRVADCDAIVWQIQIDIGYWSSPHFLLLICLLEHTGWCRNMASSVTQEWHEPFTLERLRAQVFSASQRAKQAFQILLDEWLPCMCGWVLAGCGKEVWGMKRCFLEILKHAKCNWNVQAKKSWNWGDSYERAGTLGFRCAADVQGGAPAPYHYRHDIQFVWVFPRPEVSEVSSGCCLVALDATQSEVPRNYISHQKAQAIKQWQIPKHRQERDERPAASQIVAVWKTPSFKCRLTGRWCAGRQIRRGWFSTWGAGFRGDSCQQMTLFHAGLDLNNRNWTSRFDGLKVPNPKVGVAMILNPLQLWQMISAGLSFSMSWVAHPTWDVFVHRSTLPHWKRTIRHVLTFQCQLI